MIIIIIIILKRKRGTHDDTHPLDRVTAVGLEGDLLSLGIDLFLHLMASVKRDGSE